MMLSPLLPLRGYQFDDSFIGLVDLFFKTSA